MEYGEKRSQKRRRLSGNVGTEPVQKSRKRDLATLDDSRVLASTFHQDDDLYATGEKRKIKKLKKEDRKDEDGDVQPAVAPTKPSLDPVVLHAKRKKARQARLERVKEKRAIEKEATRIEDAELQTEQVLPSISFSDGDGGAAGEEAKQKKRKERKEKAKGNEGRRDDDHAQDVQNAQTVTKKRRENDLASQDHSQVSPASAEQENASNGAGEKKRKKKAKPRDQEPEGHDKTGNDEPAQGVQQSTSVPISTRDPAISNATRHETQESKLHDEQLRKEEKRPNRPGKEKRMRGAQKAGLWVDPAIWETWSEAKRDEHRSERAQEVEWFRQARSDPFSLKDLSKLFSSTAPEKVSTVAETSSLTKVKKGKKAQLVPSKLTEADRIARKQAKKERQSRRQEEGETSRVPERSFLMRTTLADRILRPAKCDPPSKCIEKGSIITKGKRDPDFLRARKEAKKEMKSENLAVAESRPECAGMPSGPQTFNEPSPTSTSKPLAFPGASEKLQETPPLDERSLTAKPHESNQGLQCPSRAARLSFHRTSLHIPTFVAGNLARGLTDLPVKFECPPDRLRRSSREDQEAWMRRRDEESDSESDSDSDSELEEVPRSTKGSWHESWHHLIHAQDDDEFLKKAEDVDSDGSKQVCEVVNEVFEDVLGDHDLSLDDRKPEPKHTLTGLRDDLTIPHSVEPAKDLADQDLNGVEEHSNAEAQEGVEQASPAGSSREDHLTESLAEDEDMGDAELLEEELPQARHDSPEAVQYDLSKRLSTPPPPQVHVPVIETHMLQTEQTVPELSDGAQDEEIVSSRFSTPPPQAQADEARGYYSPQVIIPQYELQELEESEALEKPDENVEPSFATPYPPRVIIPQREIEEAVEKLPLTPNVAQPRPSVSTPTERTPAKKTPSSKRKSTGTVSKYFIDNRVDLYNTTSSGRKVPTGTSVVPAPSIFAEKFGIIQEDTWNEPFWLLVAVSLLNKTTGRAAVPVFKQIRYHYSTPEDLAKAEFDDLLRIIGHLGLQRGRTHNLIELAKTWVETPPVNGRLYRKRDYPNKGDGKAIDVANIVEEDMPICQGAIEIGHLRGCGAYAYDSWRIFCRDVLRGVADDFNGRNAPTGFEPEWRRVVPNDKELRACLRWMWLREGYIWDPLTGYKREATDAEMHKAVMGEMEVEDAQEAKFVKRAAGVEVSPQKQPTGDQFGSSQTMEGTQELVASKEAGVDQEATTSQEDKSVVDLTGEDDPAVDDITAEDIQDTNASSAARNRRGSHVSSASSRRKTPTRQAKVVRSIEPPEEPLPKKTRAKKNQQEELEGSQRSCVVA